MNGVCSLPHADGRGHFAVRCGFCARRQRPIAALGDDPDVASRFNHKMGETFVVPKELIREETQLIPGLDGEKMSKSKGNTLDIFADAGAMKKRINKKLSPTRRRWRTPKIPTERSSTTCTNSWPRKATQRTWQNPPRGGYGWGHAKKALLEAVVDGFASEREEFNRWMTTKRPRRGIGQRRRTRPSVAQPVLDRVRRRSDSEFGMLLGLGDENIHRLNQRPCNTLHWPSASPCSLP